MLALSKFQVPVLKRFEPSGSQMAVVWIDHVSVQNWTHRIQFIAVSVSQRIVTQLFGPVTISIVIIFFWTVFSRYCIPVDMELYYGEHDCVSDPLWQPYTRPGIWIISDQSLNFTNIK